MNTWVDTNEKTFTAGEALEANRLVKKSASTVLYADAGEASIGVTKSQVDNGEAVAVKLWSASGTFLIEATAAITENAAVYAANDGKVDIVVLGDSLGSANEAATAAGQLIEIIA